MDSVAHAADSSSASADSRITIRKTEWASAGILKVYQEEGPSFFVRPEYLSSPEALTAPDGSGELDEERSSALYQAARSFLAERSALDSLARAEQCRVQLALKLRKKGFSDAEIGPALDFLESTRSLDDSRFAEAWLRNHAIHQFDGRKKLLAALLERGVKFGIADTALDAFFDTVGERELCLKAAQKFVRLGKSGEKLVVALMRKGFSPALIKDCLKSIDNPHHVE